MPFCTSESLAFGELTLACVSSPDVSGRLNIARVDCASTLGDHIDVEVVNAYIIEFVSTSPTQNFTFDITLHGCPAKGNPESGEHLDAQSWGLDEGFLMIGTEDGDVLHERMPWIEIEPSDQHYPIEYLDNGFRLSLPYVPPNSLVEFHFVLAYNAIESDNVAEWLAVDIPHRKLFGLPVLKRIAGADAG